IADTLYRMVNFDKETIKNIDNKIELIERDYMISYNAEQRKAIKEALENQVTIITGGPGTGKTTIINGIIRLYQEVNGLPNHKMKDHIQLLAPTGRASKRMCETTLFPASTIHRYLKWNHETGDFAVNEYNKTKHDLIIVDELSMIDNNLFSSLLDGISMNAKLVLVGDSNQLPSVGPGNILKDLIDSDMIPHIELKNIYRQSANSFIPTLASEIKNVYIESDLSQKRDDYNFIKCDRIQIKQMIQEIIKMAKNKGLDETDMQVLIPMYKGENGIDNINVLLQNIFNPENDSKKEITIGTTVFREKDKIINLVNNVENNIFNGDIGYITKINPKKSDEIMEVDFYGNKVTFKREELSANIIKHAYAMSIHKSQGSEFNHVIMPISKEYSRMLYNKLIYTGVSRARKSLLLIGDEEAFIRGVNNSYSEIRKTALKELLLEHIK
ncbi:MAG: AAA family ATPase, partial [Bacilli bacterium]|nr:AAA family ATPase [Bacilli bacterium]